MSFQNYFATKLYTDIGAADTTITLETPPVATSGRLCLEARNAQQREIVKYTGVSGNQITGVTRGQGGTTAKSHLKNALVEMNATAEDLQDLYDAFSSFSVTNNDWRTAASTVTSVTHNGNRSYDVGFSASMAALLSPGMRLRTTRTVAAPTTSTLLNGTNNYLSKATPAGMTFTDDFAVGAWIKLSAYPSSACGIISRYNGTSGWALGMFPNGQLWFCGFNGSSVNLRQVHTYQSVPLNKWVHITAQLDMSAYTTSPTTCYAMFDGVDIPIYLEQTGTNPTSITQAGNLEIGSFNGANFFPGKIAQAFVTSAKITQANVRSLMTYSIDAAAVTANSIVSAYSLNNSLTDINTTNANNLTNNNSTVINTADSPFGGQADGSISSTLDYAIVQKVNGTVVTVQVAEGCTIPTSGGITAVSYSSARSPYAFPGEKAKWRLSMYLVASQSLAIGAVNSWIVCQGNLSIPTGKWAVGYKADVAQQSTVSGVRRFYFAAYDMTAPYPLPADDLACYREATGTSYEAIQFTAETPRSFATNTAYQFAVSLVSATGSESWNISSRQASHLYADNAYL